MISSAVNILVFLQVLFNRNRYFVHVDCTRYLYSAYAPRNSAIGACRDDDIMQLAPSFLDRRLDAVMNQSMITRPARNSLAICSKWREPLTEALRMSGARRMW